MNVLNVVKPKKKANFPKVAKNMKSLSHFVKLDFPFYLHYFPRCWKCHCHKVSLCMSAIFFLAGKFTDTYMYFADSCTPHCANGGICIGHNLCSCPHGFSGPDCQDKTCTVHCENGGVCTMPDNKCKCRDGYYGARCHKK